MRVLVVSNFYPPYAIGGYELVCAQVVTWLVSRGVDVTVLTQRKVPSSEAPRLSVQGRLYLSFSHDPAETGTFKRHLRQTAFGIYNYFALVRLCSRWKPDLIYVFNPSGLGALMLEWMHRSRVRPAVVHDISDEWLLSAYEHDAWFNLAGLEVWTPMKRGIRDLIVALGRVFLPVTARPLALAPSYFRSGYLKSRFAEAGASEAVEAQVIHHGIELTVPETTSAAPPSGDILFASRLCREKGLHVLLRAVALMKEQRAALKLTVVGSGSDKAYLEELDTLIAGLPKSYHVEMVGHRTLPELQQLLRAHSIFAFPVTWDEPFSLTLMEAMSAGAAVVATATGGSKEILRHQENAWIVERDDAESLATGLLELLGNPELRERLGSQARETVQAFELEKTFERIGRHLHSVVGDKAEALLNP